MTKDFGLKVSREDNSVFTAEGNHLLFNSEYPALKIANQGKGSVTFSNNEGYHKLVDHNLGYAPFFNVWVDDGSGYKMTPFGAGGANFWIGYLGSARDDDLYLIAVTTYTGGYWGDPTPPPDKTVDYAWIIYYDPIK